MYIALLGRQPEISLAELQAMYGKKSVRRISSSFASVDSTNINIDKLGGTIKIGEIIKTLNSKNSDHASLLDASRFVVANYTKKWQNFNGKITLGISVYDLKTTPKNVQKTGIILKQKLKAKGTSLRIIPNKEVNLSTATSHNNKLGSSDKKIELIVCKTFDGKTIIAESRGVQNITAYTIRDRERPKRDAFVGMLPPKLAQIMLNIATENSTSATVLDPFCGTGTVLQEALLRGFEAHGSDLSQKMINYSQANIDWLAKTHKLKNAKYSLTPADATNHTWPNSKDITAVVCETYLGQPFSAPPSPKKLAEVVKNCDHIISEFLKNLHPQLTPGTKLCIAIPAWRSDEAKFTHLPLTRRLDSLGYAQTSDSSLLYYRADQVVARQLLKLTVK